MGKYLPYAEYQESDIDWVEKLPKHWGASKLRYMFSFGKGLTITKANLLDEGIPCVNYGEVHSKYGFEFDPDIHPLKCVEETYLESSPNALLEKGDLVFADTSEDIEGSGNFTQLIIDKAVFAGYHTIIGRPNDRECSRFYAYLLDSVELRTQIRDAVKGVKVFSITQAILKGIDIWLPPLGERRKIANFLDQETSKIDILIAKQQHLIKLIKEKRQAVISHAVTKGLNAAAPMCDSGIDWFGEVPKHWVVSKVGFCTVSLDHLRIPIEAGLRGDMQGQYPYFGASGVIDHVNDFLFDEPLVLVCEDGWNLMLRSKAVARKVQGKIWVNNHAHILRPSSLDPFLLAECIEQTPLHLYVSGMRQPKLTADALKNIPIVYPADKKEQTQLVEYIKDAINKYSNIDKKTKRNIKLLQERRKTLISVAVTGKIDVRNWQAPEPSTSNFEAMI